MKSSHQENSRKWALPVGFSLIATIVAYAGSWIPSLWGDEAASVLSARRPIGSLFTLLGHVDAVHGTYYFALHIWIRLFGSSLAALLLPGAIGAGLCAAGVIVLMRQLSTETMAVVAGVVCTVLPRLTYAGAEVRSYSFEAALATWLTVVLIVLFRDPANHRFLWVAYGVLFALAIYIFLYLALLAAAHAVILLFCHNRRMAFYRWTITFVIALLTTTPLLYWAFIERHQVSYLHHRHAVSFTAVASSTWFGNPWFAVLAWALIVTGLFLGLPTWLHSHRTIADPGATGSLSVTLVAASWLVIPSILLLISNLVYADFTDRYLTFCAPAAAILVAQGIVRLAERVEKRQVLAAAVITAIVVIAALPEYLIERSPTGKNGSDWAQISETIKEHSSAGDAIVFDESTRPSRQPRLALNLYPAGFTGVEDVTLRTPYYKNTTWYDSVYTVAKAARLGQFRGIARVWMVEYSTATHSDHWGQADLTAIGFTPVAHFRTARTEITEWTRRLP